MHWGNVKRYKNKKEGFGLVEIVVGAGIISLVSFGLFQASILSLRAVGRAGDTVQTAFLIEEGMEAIKYVRDNGWTGNLDNGTLSNDGTTYYIRLSSTDFLIDGAQPSPIDGKFTRTVLFHDVCRDSSTQDIIDVVDTAGVCSSGDLDTGTRRVDITITWDNGERSQSAQFYVANIYSDS